MSSGNLCGRVLVGVRPYRDRTDVPLPRHVQAGKEAPGARWISPPSSAAQWNLTMGGPPPILSGVTWLGQVFLSWES